METLYNVIIFMPAVICFVWLVISLLNSKKTFRSWMCISLLAELSLYLYSSSVFITRPVDYAQLPVFDVLCAFMGLSIVPAIWRYLLSLKDLKLSVAMRTVVPALVILVGVITAVLYFMVGLDEAILYRQQKYEGIAFSPANPQLMDLLHIVTFDVFRGLLVIELLLFFLYTLWNAGGFGEFFKTVFGFVFGKEQVTIYSAQLSLASFVLLGAFLRFMFPEPYLVQHTALTICIYIVLSVILGAFCYMTQFNDVPVVSMEDFFSAVVPYSALDEVPEALAPVSERVLQNSDNAFGLTVTKNENLAFTPLPDDVLVPLRESFQRYFDDGKKYLEGGITLARIAADIHSNKNYVSRMVHMTYDMTFPEYLNKKRIEYAKSMLLEDPDIKQEVLAEECGFANASAFNRAFRRVTDKTPRMWLAEQNKI